MGEEELSRRRLLAGAGGGLAIGAVAGLLAPDGTTAPIDGILDFPAAGEAERPREEAEVPYAVYQYEPVDGQFEPTSPINVVFPLDDGTFEDVISVFREANWYSRPAEYARYAYDRATDTWQRSHWSGAETIFGVAGRLHVRCWELDGTASIQAHIDTPATPRHRILSYIDGARAVTELFAAAGWAVDPGDPDVFPLDNEHPPDHPGFAMVIRR